MRITRKDLQATIYRLYTYYGFKCNLNVQSNMPGCGYRVESEDGKRDISPRLNASEMDAWLNGFQKALDEIKFNGLKVK